MNTTPIYIPEDNSGKKWTRKSIAAAVAAGAITVEAANILYQGLSSDQDADFESGPDSAEVLNTEAAPVEPIESVDPQEESATEAEETILTEPTPIPEPIPEPTPIPEPEPLPENEAENIVDVIVEEIDPQDIDMEDIILVDNIGSVYTTDGEELNAVLIHDANGNQALMVDIDNDDVYDVIVDQEGELIAQVGGDIDVSDVELMHSHQHGHSDYLEPNSYDVAMNEVNNDIHDNISLT